MPKPEMVTRGSHTSESRDSLSTEERVHVLSLVEGLAAAEVGTTCILLWRGPVTETRFQLQREAIEHVVGRHPGEAAILCIIEPTSEPPSEELRESASKLLSMLGTRIRCVAYVVEGTGFRAAMIRGVLSSIEMLKRGKTFPSRYFATVGQAAAWIGLETASPSFVLLEAAEHLRSRMDSVDERASRGSSPAKPSWPLRS